MKVFFLSLVVMPFCIFESIRFHTLYQTCNKTHKENKLLLAGTDCNAWERHEFQKKDKMCHEAEEEQKITPFWCAWHRLWQEGEPLRVWKMFTESHWMLWGISLPVICFIIYQWFASCHQARALKMQEKMYRETLEAVKRVNTITEVPHPPLEVENGFDLVPRAGVRRRLVA